MIPVCFIEGVVIEGDCRISEMIFGDSPAVEKASQRATARIRTSRLHSFVNLSRQNLEMASVIECRTREEDLGAIDSRPDSPQLTACLPVPVERAEEVEVALSPSSSPVNLSSRRRSSSYQIVFDVSDNEGDEDDDGIVLSHSSIDKVESCDDSRQSHGSSRNNAASPPREQPPLIPPELAFRLHNVSRGRSCPRSLPSKASSEFVCDRKNDPPQQPRLLPYHSCLNTAAKPQSNHKELQKGINKNNDQASSTSTAKYLRSPRLPPRIIVGENPGTNDSRRIPQRMIPLSII